jgi:hypothetical protein
VTVVRVQARAGVRAFAAADNTLDVVAFTRMYVTAPAPPPTSLSHSLMPRT